MQHGARRRTSIVTRPGSLAIAFAIVVGSALVVGSPARAETTWEPDDAAQVVAVSVTETGERKGVTVSWPAPTTGDYDGFQLRRNGIVVASVDAATLAATDDAPVAGPSSYTVVATRSGAIDGQLQPATVRFPWFAPAGVVLECNLLWTGSASQSWHDERNWAPFGVVGSEGVPRPPGTSDRVCVDHQAKLPIEVTEPNANALAFTGTQPGPATLRMVDGDLTLTQPSIIPAIELLGGRLDLKAATRLVDVDRPVLVLGGGHLVIGERVFGAPSFTSPVVAGGVEVLAGTTSILDGGRLDAVSLDLDHTSSSSIEGRNGHLASIADQVTVNGGATLTTGTGGATLWTSNLTARDGTNRVEWELAGLSASSTIDVNVEAGETRLTDLLELVDDGTPEGKELWDFRTNIAGTLVIDEQIERIGFVELRGNGQLRPGGTSDNLGGIIEANSLALDATPPILLDRDFRAAQIRLDGGSELTVSGALESYMAFEMNSAELRDGRLTVGAGWSTDGSSAVDIVGAPGKPFVVDGDVRFEGSVRTSYFELPGEEENNSPAYGATFTGDVAFGLDSAWSLSVTRNPDDQPEVTVQGNLAVAGTLVVRVPPGVPETFQRRLVAATNRDLDPIETVIDGPDDVRIEERPDGIWAVRGESTAPGSWGPGASPRVASITVDGAGVPTAVTVQWPDPVTDFEGFQLRRDDVVVPVALGPDARTAVDPSPTPGPAVYAVVGLIDGLPGPAISSMPVVFPADPTCNLVWSGAVSSEWGVADNWTPIGLAGSEGAVRVPSAGDHACVPQSDPTLISVTEAAAVADRVTGPRAEIDLRGRGLTARDVAVESVALRSASLTVEEPIVIPPSGRLVVEDGAIVSGSIEVAGTLAVGLERDQQFVDVAVSGDLRLRDGSRTEVNALVVGGEEPEFAPSVAVGGELALAGSLLVDVPVELLDPSLETLFSADPGSVTGAFDTIELTGEIDGVFIEVVSDGVLLRRGDGAPGEWGPGVVPQVRALTIGGGGTPSSATFTWPDPVKPFVYFELRRNGEWAASGGQTVRQLTDSSPVAGPAVYTVVGINLDGSESSIATAPVVFPSDVSCSIVWVGSVGDRWSDVRNWAPMGVASLGGAVRVPLVSDHVCVPQRARVFVADVPAVAGRVSGPDAELSVADAGLTVGDVTVRSLEVAGGTVSTGALTVNEISVVLGGRLGAGAVSLVGDGPRVSVTDGEVGSSATIVVTDGQVLLDGRSTVTASLELAGTSILSVGGGDVAASIGFERDLVLSADGSVVFSVDPARPPVVFVEGVATLAGVLVVDVVEGLPDPFEWPLIVAESPPLLGGFSEVELTGVVEGVRVELLPAAVGLVRGSPQWAVGDAVQVESLVVDAAGVPVSVGLSWPEMSLVPSGFDVVRVVDGADEVIGSVGGGVTSFVDVDPVADARYRVDAVSGGVKVASLGDPRVVFPSDVSCSIVWTGSSGDEWSDVRNWAPMGVATLGGAVRVPSVSDHVCIPQGSAVALMDASVVVGRVSGAGANLSVFDAEFVAGNVSLSRLAASSATVSAGVVVVDSVVLRDGSGLFVESIEFSGSSVSLSRLEMVDSEIGSLEPIVLPVGVTAFFDGSVEVSGSLDIADGLLVGLLAGTSVAISGGLVVRPTATVLFRADFGGAGGGAGPTSVVAQGDVQLGGALRVELVSELADSFEFALVRSGSLLTGEFASTTFIGESAGASVAQRTDGIYLLGPAGACAAAPDANGVDVSGCWIDNGDDTYTHTDDLVESPADEPALGGIELDPQPGIELTLDLTDPATPVLSADGPVQVTFEIRPPSGPSENWTVIEPSMSWSLGGAGNPLTTGTFLGLPGVPVLANDAGTLRIRAVGFLPAPFDGAAFTVEVPVSGGAITAPAASAPGVSIGGVLEPTDMTLGHRSGSRWNVGSAGPGVRLDADLTFLPDGRIGTGTIDLRGTDLAGLADADTVFTFDPASRTWNGDLGDGRSVRFTEGTGGRLGNGSFIDLGSIDLGFFQVDGPIRITRTGGGTWQLPSRPGLSDIVQGIELRFDRGRLDVGQLRFGDLDPLIDNIPTLGDVAGWLPLGGFDAGYDAVRDVWFVNAWLDEPDIAVRGEVGFEDGALATGALAIEGVPLGSLALLDLDLAVTGPGTFELDASLVGAAFEGARSGSGSLTFDDGELVGATVEFQQLPIGDLFVIDDFTFAYDSSTATTWEVNGRVSSPTDGGAPALVEGSLEFTDGVLTGAMLELRDVGFGPSTIDLLSFELDRTTASGPRESTYRVAGAVRGPRPVGGGADIPAPLEPITGSATILDGRLTGFSVTVPSLEIPGFAYLRDLAVSYQQTGTTAVLAGNGAVRTATSGSAFTAGSFQALIDDGRVDQLLISATRLDLAGLLAVETFQAAYNRSAPIGNCSGLDSGDPATIYSLSGTVGGSALAGCIALAGRSLVGALLTVDQLEIADLLTIQNFRAEYASSAGYPVAQVDDEGKDVGPVTLRRTALDVGGRVTVGGTPVQIDGFLELTDGGVSQFDLAVDSIPLSATVALTDVEINYQAGARFSATATRAYAISANAVHDQGTTSATGSLVFRPDGRVQSAGLQITELPLGPVTLEQLTFAYVRTVSETEWLAGARLTAPDDPNVVVDVTGQARFERGRLTFAQLDVPALSVGELIMVTDLQLGFERFANGSERWSGTGGVAGLGQATDPATATVRLDIGADGRFTSGLINVGHVRWGGLFHLTDLTLSGSRNASTGLGVWSVNGRMSIGGGATSQVSGSLRLRDGRVVAGSLSVSNLGIAGVVAIQNLVVTAQTADGNTVWTVAGAASVGGGGRVDMGGEFEWRRGRLDRGLLTLGNVPIGELFRIDGFRLEYDAGERWAAAGTIVDEDGTSTLGGELLFTDGVVSGGLLDVANLQLGPLDLVSGKLRFDSTGRAGSAVCGVSDSSGPGTRYSLEATIRAGDGTTTSAAGRLRIDGGRVTEGVVCASGVKFADFLVLDDFNVRLAETTGPAGTTTTFSGAATASTPGNPPVSASVDFAVRARQLQTLDIEVGGIVFGDLLTLRNASLTYDRAATGTSYALAAVVAQPGGDATFAGSLGITDGIITSGSLTLSQLRFGDSFTLTNLQISYFGRSRAVVFPGAVQAGGTTDCAATPTDDNVPSNSPGAPRWAQFAVAATVEANGDTYAASGSLLFGDGDLKGFDISLACLPIGDFKTLEGVRIAKRPGSFEFAGRLRDDQGTSGASGFFTFDDGRVAGGEIVLNRVPLGPLQLREVRATFGENLAGDTQYALTVVAQAGDSAPIGGGGSLTMRDGRVVAGSIQIAGLKLLDLFTIDNFVLNVDGSTPGTLRLATALQVSGTSSTPPSGEVAATLTLVDGRVTAGSFVIGGVRLFDAIPVGRVSANFDSVAQRWGFEINVQVGSSGPAIVAAAEFQRGRVISGSLGFDIDGDGLPDGTPGAVPPTGGSAEMSWFPVRALFASFCSASATASYCLGEGVSSWSGRIGIELPTDAAPALDMQLRVVDGAFDYASATLSFGTPGIPVYPAVYLTSLSGSLRRNPWQFGGGIGIGIGPGLVNIDGALLIGEGPQRPANVNPADYEPEYVFFSSVGTAAIPIPGVTVQIQASNVFQSNGYVGMAVEGSIGLGRVVEIEGGVEGAVFNASGSGMNLTNPETGQRLTGWHAQARGFVEARIFDVRVAGAEGYVNTIGAYAQADLVLFGCLGGGMYWSSGRTAPTCDYGRYAIQGVSVTDNPNLPQFLQGFAPLVAEPSTLTHQFTEFDVAPGEEVLGVEVLGTGSELDDTAASPDTALRSPSGQIYRLADNDPDNGLIVFDSANKRWFFVADPEPGTWRLESSATSVPISEVLLSRKLPDVAVSGSLTPSGPDMLLDYQVGEIPGQEVLFFERAVGGDPFEAMIGTSTGTSGQIRFTPSGSATGGTREVVANVMQNGFTRREIVIGTYEAPDAQSAGPPQSVSVSEIAAGARVTWQPPASNGGRRITSYRVSSDIGWTVSVPADLDGGYRGELPIPAMQAGQTINVYVQARTGLGWGEPAAASFTSSQNTGLQYLQGEVPQTDRADLGGGLVSPPVPDPGAGNPPPANPGLPPTTGTPAGPPVAPVAPPPVANVPLGGVLPQTGSSSGLLPVALGLALLALGVVLRSVGRSDRAANGAVRQDALSRSN